MFVHTVVAAANLKEGDGTSEFLCNLNVYVLMYNSHVTTMQVFVMFAHSFVCVV